jgi:hypothetical protein
MSKKLTPYEAFFCNVPLPELIDKKTLTAGEGVSAESKAPSKKKVEASAPQDTP